MRSKNAATDSVAWLSQPKAPTFRPGPCAEPQSPRRPLGRDQISEKVSSPSLSKRLA